MNRSIVSLCGIALLSILLSACGNNSNSSNSAKTGTVNFFHMVTNASRLSLASPNNDDRGLGTIEFGTFGPGITLNAKNWDLKVTDIRDELDGSDDVTLLTGVNFPVVRDRRTVQALIGDYAANTVELVSLTLAYDEQRGKGDLDGDGIPDNQAQYINFSSIVSDPALASLDVYLVDVANCNDLSLPATPTATVTFKNSTTPIRLEEGKTRFCLRVASAGTEIYNSGEKTLRDYLQQTIILAPFTGSVSSGSTSQITAYYFGDSAAEKWLTADSKGQIRIYNAIKDCANLNFTLANADPLNIPTPVASALAFKGLSDFSQVDTKFVAWTVAPDCAGDPSFFDGAGQLVNVEDGQSWTVVYFGRIAGAPDSSTAVAVPETTTIFSNKSSVTFTNAAYVQDEDKRKPLNIHITTGNEAVTAASVDIPALGYAEYGTTVVNSGVTYTVTATDDTNRVVKAQTSFVTDGGENIHFVLHEKAAGGYEIDRLVGEAVALRTTITADKTTATADGVDVMTLTVQVRDFSGNKISTAGDTVVLTTTSSAVISAVVDNGNGSYTVTVTDTVAESAVIEGTLNGDAITTKSLTFN